MIRYPLKTPMCPYCERLQHDYQSSLNLEKANYGDYVNHFCEYENCGKIFVIKKVEADPRYKSYTREERDE